MPKISEAHRALKREQILNAAWRCFQRHGVQSATMEQIIAESGLSASAMYRYFKGKDDIIEAAIITSLTGLTALLAPILADRDLDPARTLGAICGVIEGFSVRDGFDLRTIGVQGWAEAQTSPAVRRTMQNFHLAFREHLTARVTQWQADGMVGPGADPRSVAQAMHSLILGYVVQHTLIGTTAEAHGEGLAGLLTRS